ncbi:MAG: serine/threonine-protein phosphatase [Deltaproteobacteria bacterium]|nr:serine/threonine-protein phosphatase [Deltaproteobacteria bacterium]
MFDSNSPGTGEYRLIQGRPLRYGAASETGHVRLRNEDAYGLFPEHGLFVVADGLGGHAGGEVASRTAVRAMGDFFLATADGDAGDGRERALAAVKFANTIIWNMALADDDLGGMGTTIAAIAVDSVTRRVVCAHVGDSRIYRVSDGKLTRLTRDHSLARLLFLSDREAKRSLVGSTLFRALGTHSTVEVEVSDEAARIGDRFVLASDGLTHELNDDEIQSVVTVGVAGPAETARRLVNAALKKGGRDNVTIVVADV